MRNSETIREVVRKIIDAEGPAPELLETFRQRYEEASIEDRVSLFSWMELELEVSRAQIAAPLAELSAVEPHDDAGWSRALSGLRSQLRSPRKQVFERLANITGGVKFLLELRTDVLESQRRSLAQLDLLDQDISDLLNGWFREGFLFLKEVDQSSPFHQIRYLKERELVHPMVSLEEMGQRLGEDRRCFALYHCVMPDEPVVFIEVALAKGLVRSIHEIIEDRETNSEERPSPNTAIFYSINNTQHGLAGLGLGKVLILRVTEALKQSHPGLRTFATLSPIPGFWTRYLKPLLQDCSKNEDSLEEDRLQSFGPKARQAILRRHQELGGPSDSDFPAALIHLLSRPDWIEDELLCRYLKRPLRELVFDYLTHEVDSRGRPSNPVARFHIGNGATLSFRNVHFGANRNSRGLEESCGLMVNYVYSSTAFQQIRRTVHSLLPWAH